MAAYGGYNDNRQFQGQFEPQGGYNGYNGPQDHQHGQNSYGGPHGNQGQRYGHGGFQGHNGYHENQAPPVGATFHPGGGDDYYMPELVSPAPQR